MNLFTAICLLLNFEAIFAAPNVFLTIHESGHDQKSDESFLSWLFPSSDWEMPPSRTEAPEQQNSTWLGNATSEVKHTIDDLGSKLNLDFITSVLTDVAETIFNNEDEGKEEEKSEVNEAIEKFTVYSARDIPISGLGFVGEIVNDSVSAVLNAIVAYQHRNEADCLQHLICESNRDIYGRKSGRDRVIPAVVAYATNLVLAGLVASDNDVISVSEVLKAARGGRKGRIECRENYPLCTVTL